jgi:Ca2+-binding EF-hand superfamily protein
MADKHKQILEDVFNHHDKNKSGKLEVSELQSAVKDYYKKAEHKEPTQEQVDSAVGGILKAVDKSGDGKIDKAEWFKYFAV